MLRCNQHPGGGAYLAAGTVRCCLPISIRAHRSVSSSLALRQYVGTMAESQYPSDIFRQVSPLRHTKVCVSPLLPRFCAHTAAVPEFLLEFYNKCWEKGEIPADWYETLISYIYKKGKLQELTSYRPIALTSMLANIFKTMWLQRLVPVIDKHLSHCQGGFG